MSDEIRVHVVKYPDRENLVMRYPDPYTGRHVAKSTRDPRITKEADRRAAVWQDELRNGRFKSRRE